MSADIDKVLEPKSLGQLLQLEKQVDQKLNSSEPIDEDYWEQLLVRIGVYKAKAQLSRIHASIMARVVEIARSEYIVEAERLKQQYAASQFSRDRPSLEALAKRTHDAETLLSLAASGKAANVIEEADFIAKTVSRSAPFGE